MNWTGKYVLKEWKPKLYWGYSTLTVIYVWDKDWVCQ